MTNLTDALTENDQRRIRVTSRADVAQLSGVRRRVIDFVNANGGTASEAADLELIVSELATNVILHTSSDTVTVALECRPEQWILDVADADELPPLDSLPEASPDQIAGRGLQIVQAVADSVHTVDDGDGVVIRCVCNRDAVTRVGTSSPV